MDLVIKVFELIIALVENKYFFRNRYDKQNLIILKIYKNLKCEEPNKWYICNLFNQLTQLNLNFKDIKLLLQNDDVEKIIYFISKYRGIYTYKNGFFTEKKSRLINRFFNGFMKLSAFVFFVFWVFFAWSFFIEKSFSAQIVYFIFLVITSGYWLYSLKAIDEIKEAQILLDSHVTLTTC